MDFYRYLNSKDVAEHLRRMEYQFNALECAWIIDNIMRDNKNIPLSEKLAALNHVLTMPDYVYTSEEYPNGVSIHETIRQHLDYIDTIKAELKEKDNNTIYTYYLLNDKGWFHQNAYFRDYDSCMTSYFQALLNSIDPSYCNQREILGYRIEKIPFNEQDGRITAEYRGSELVSIHKLGSREPLVDVMLDVFETDRVYFPAPFLPGDILYDPMYRCPIVLEELPADAGIFLMCYRVSEDGKTVIHYCSEMPYEYLEYYREELKGTDIALSVISDFIKNKGNTYGKE